MACEKRIRDVAQAMRGTKALMLDHDGTYLEISKPGLHEAHEHVARLAGIVPPWPPGLEGFLRWFDCDWRKNYRRMGIADDRMKQCKAWFLESYGAVPRGRRRHADRVLAAALARSLRLALVTNNARSLVIEDLGPDADSFEVILTTDEILKAKPDPSGLNMALARLGLSPGEAAYAGDDVVDVRAALGAGVLPIGVTGGLRERDELEAAGAELVVTLEELALVLERD